MGMERVRTGAQPSPPRETPVVTEGGWAEVQRLLDGRTRHIRLEGELAQLFRERSARQAAKIIRAWMVWVVLLDVVTLTLNLLLLPSQTATAMFLPASLLLPAAISTAIFFSKPRGPRQQFSVLLGGILVILLSVALVGVASGGEFYERHLTIMLFVAVTAIVIFPVPLTLATMVGVGAIFIYLIFQLRNPMIGPGSAIAGSLFFAAGIMATLVARRTAIILAQKTFLLELRDRKRLADLKDANGRLERLARTDPLTGVANRRSMMATLEAHWKNGPGGLEAAMLMCDVDDFKRLNDSLGHAEGDRCLVKVAGIIESSLRNDNDQVARFGGEEFLIFLPSCDATTALSLAETIRQRVEAASFPNPASRAAPVVTLSIGVATLPPDRAPKSVDDLQREADAALYAAKREGRNRTRVCTHGSSANQT